jgi:hypothetical protein
VSRFNLTATGAPGERWSSIPMWSNTGRRHPESHASGRGEATANQCWWKWALKVWAHYVIVFHRALSSHYPEIRSYLLRLSGGTHSRLTGAIGLWGKLGH